MVTSKKQSISHRSFVHKQGGIWRAVRTATFLVCHDGCHLGGLTTWNTGLGGAIFGHWIGTNAGPGASWILIFPWSSLVDGDLVWEPWAPVNRGCGTGPGGDHAFWSDARVAGRWGRCGFEWHGASMRIPKERCAVLLVVVLVRIYINFHVFLVPFHPAWTLIAKVELGVAMADMTHEYGTGVTFQLKRDSSRAAVMNQWNRLPTPWQTMFIHVRSNWL